MKNFFAGSATFFPVTPEYDLIQLKEEETKPSTEKFEFNEEDLERLEKKKENEMKDEEIEILSPKKIRKFSALPKDHEIRFSLFGDRTKKEFKEIRKSSITTDLIYPLHAYDVEFLIDGKPKIYKMFDINAFLEELKSYDHIREKIIENRWNRTKNLLILVSKELSVSYKSLENDILKINRKGRNDLIPIITESKIPSSNLATIDIIITLIAIIEKDINLEVIFKEENKKIIKKAKLEKKISIQKNNNKKEIKKEENPTSVYEKYLKLGYEFTPIQFPKMGRSFQKTKDLSKAQKKSRFERYVKIMQIMIPMIVERWNLTEISLLNTIKEDFYNWKCCIDKNGDFVVQGNDYFEENQWLQDYLRKQARGISNDTYKETKAPYETPLDDIHSELKKIFRKNGKLIKIIMFVESFTNKNMEKNYKPRQAGIILKEMFVNFIERNPDYPFEIIENTKKDLEERKKISPEMYQTTKPVLYKDNRKYYYEMITRIIFCTAMIIAQHDGGKNKDKKSMSGYPDKECFELGLFSWGDGRCYYFPNYLFWFFVFIDLSKSKFHLNSDIIKVIIQSLVDEIVQKKIKIEISATKAKKIDENIKGDEPVTIILDFSLVFCMDHKALLFYLNLLLSSCSARVLVSNRIHSINDQNFNTRKCKIYFKNNIYNTSNTVDFPSAKFILPFKKLYLVSGNLILLFNDPFRNDLKIPYPFLKYKKIPFLSSITDVKQDKPVHLVQGFMRCILTYLSAQIKRFSKHKILKKEGVKNYFKEYVEAGIFQYNEIFGEPSPLDVRRDYSKPLKLRKNYTTIKADKYKKLFSNNFIKKFVSLLKTNSNDDEFANEIIEEFGEIYQKLGNCMMNICSTLRKREILSNEEILDCGYNMDIFYIFMCFAIQVSNQHSNYLNELLSTLALDLFFDRTPGKISCDYMEGFVKDSRKKFRTSTSGQKNFGIRKEKFYAVNEPFLQEKTEDPTKFQKNYYSNEDELKKIRKKKLELDAVANTALQIGLNSMARTGDFFFRKKKIKVHVLEKEIPQAFSPNIEMIPDNLSFPFKNNEWQNNEKMELLQDFYDSCKSFFTKLWKHEEDNYVPLDYKHPYTPEMLDGPKKFKVPQKEITSLFLENDSKANTNLSKSQNIGNFGDCGTGKTGSSLAHSCRVAMQPQRSDKAFMHAINIVPVGLIEEYKGKIKFWKDVFGIENKTNRIIYCKSFNANELDKFTTFQVGRIFIVTYHWIKKLTEYMNQIKTRSNSMFVGLKEKFFNKCHFIVLDEVHKAFQAHVTQKEQPSIRSVICSNLVTESRRFVMEERLHVNVNQTHVSKKKKKEEKNGFYDDFKAFRKLIPEESFVVLLTGTPFRNNDVFCNLIHVLNNFTTEGIFQKEREILKNAFSTIRTNRPSKADFKEAVMNLVNAIDGKMYIVHPKLSVKLFTTVIEIPSTQEQFEKFPDKHIHITKVLPFNLTSLSSDCYSKEEWKKKEKEGDDTFSVEEIEKMEKKGEKISLVVDMVNTIKKNEFDKEYFELLKKEFKENAKRECNEEEEIKMKRIAHKKILIFSENPTVLHQVKKAILDSTGGRIRPSDFYYMTGEETPEQRANAKKNFENAKFAIGLCSTKTTSNGLTFRNNYLLILEPYFDHSWFEQAIFRIFRLNQKRDCFVFLFLTISEIEDYQLQEAMFESMMMKHLTSNIIKAKGNFESIHYQDEEELKLAPEIIEVFNAFDEKIKNSGRSLKYYSYHSKLKSLSNEYKEVFLSKDEMRD